MLLIYPDKAPLYIFAFSKETGSNFHKQYSEGILLYLLRKGNNSQGK